jgi:hypothetical protein
MLIGVNIRHDKERDAEKETDKGKQSFQLSSSRQGKVCGRTVELTRARGSNNFELIKHLEK